MPDTASVISTIDHFVRFWYDSSINEADFPLNGLIKQTRIFFLHDMWEGSGAAVSVDQ